MANKYSSFLTVILVVLIIVIILIATIMGIKVYKNYSDEKEVNKTIAELQGRPITNNTEDNTTNENYVGVVLDPIQGNTVTGNNTVDEEHLTTTRPTVPLYKEQYPMIGYIEIKKTNIKYPILLDGSPGALDTAVSIMYPVNATLNEEGNVVIIGHNYRNGKFFSNNKKLTTGDKIDITDLQGKKLTYTIYEIFETTANDTEYITRETGNNIEISLSTCTDDGDGRLIILARVE